MKLSCYRLSSGYLFLSILYISWLFFLSSLPGSATGPNTPTWRFLSNAGHVPLFGGLGLSLAMTFKYWPWRARVWATVGVGVAYSILDEYRQSFSPGRRASALDVCSDVVGIILAVYVLSLVRRWWRGMTGEEI